MRWRTGLQQAQAAVGFPGAVIHPEVCSPFHLFPGVIMGCPARTLVRFSAPHPQHRGQGERREVQGLLGLGGGGRHVLALSPASV